MGARQASLSFDVELVGTATAGLTVEYADALKACGVGEALVGSTSATYTPASSSVPSVTLGWYLDGKRHLMWGCRGNARIELVAGKPGIIHFEFTGADFSETDTALLSGVTYGATKPPVFMGATFTVDTYAAVLNNLSLDLGNTVALRPSIAASSGFVSAMITNREPVITIDPENVLVATKDYLGTWRLGTEIALSSAHGATAGNIFTITAPKLQYQGITMADREGIATLEATALCCVNSGDDEWQIAIT